MGILRRYAKSIAILLVALLVGAASLPARADTISDKKRERQRVRQQQAQVAAQLDALRASDQQIDAALRALNANVRGTQGDLYAAQQALEQATNDAAVAQQGIEQTSDEITQLQSQLAGLAVDSYVNPLGDSMLAVLDAATLSEAAEKRALLGVVQRRNGDVADQLDRAREDLTVQKAAAEAAAAEAEANRQVISAKLEELEAARTQQQQFDAKVEQRIESALAEAAALQSQDQALAASIARSQAALAAQLRSRSSGSSGVALSPVGSISVRTVRGITVNAQIAGRLESMLSAAAADGILLSGGGYRSSSSQVALRRAHCGSSSYAVYSMPSYQCRPPTARPGASMHERGLAIDFSSGGALLTRSSKAYKWLASHASAYGFYNLPSEPWHWSTNGT